MSKANIDVIKDYISEKYILRYNVVSNQFEYLQKYESEKNKFYDKNLKQFDFKIIELNTDWKILNENNILINLLSSHHKVSAAVLISLLKSDFVSKYNPFFDFFQSLPKWTNIDYISKLANYIKLQDEKKDRERFNRMFKKMFVRSVACSLEIKLNKQAFIFVHPKQNSGKTTFLRWLVPSKLHDYYTENIGTDKDSLIALTQNFIINLDELSTLSKQDINALKSVMSKDNIKERVPYDRTPSMMKRRCNFVGSTNKNEFLSDETGNVRWLCFAIDEIIWNTDKTKPDYKRDIDIDLLWSQAYHLLNTGFDFELTKYEILENEIANKDFIILTPEMELIMQYFDKSNENDNGAIFMTATEIQTELTKKIFGTVKLNSVNTGKALTILGFEKTSKTDKNKGFTIKGYYVKDKNNSLLNVENLKGYETIIDLEGNEVLQEKIPF